MVVLGAVIQDALVHAVEPVQAQGVQGAQTHVVEPARVRVAQDVQAHAVGPALDRDAQVALALVQAVVPLVVLQRAKAVALRVARHRVRVNVLLVVLGLVEQVALLLFVRVLVQVDVMAHVLERAVMDAAAPAHQVAELATILVMEGALVAVTQHA